MRALMVCLLFGFLGGFSSCSGDDLGVDTGLPDASVPDASLPDAGIKDPYLSNLAVSVGVLGPSFNPATILYSVKLQAWSDSIQVTPTATDSTLIILVNGMEVASGAASPPIALGNGISVISVVVQVPGAAE